tara:strand:- start:32 stop:601 length:570 start_codon:yes stop_codon:yes gene_type:complete
MVYDLLEMMEGVWVDGETLTRENYGENFISQLADLISEVHTTDVPTKKTIDIEGLVSGLRLVDNFVYDCIIDWHTTLRPNLNQSVFLHGDIWAENVIVEDGNLQGLIDWEHCAYGDPHWDFRMIRRWIGWDGLDRLLFLYNASTGHNCKREYVEMLDKISLCNSRQIRGFKKTVFDGYIENWPMPNQYP